MAKLLAEDRERTSEQELVRKCQQGDTASFRQLYRRYQQRVRSTLYQLCGEQLLDDLVQEVFLKAWKGLPKLRQTSYFSTWIYRITWNVATDQRRRFAQNSQRFAHQEFFQDSSDLMHLHYQDLVKQGLENLSFEHRVVLILHDLEDLPQKEVAEILDIPVGTVKSRLFHARSAIKTFLKSQGEIL